MKAICLLAVVMFAGLILADGQQGQTLDSLNMRCIFQFHGDVELGGLAMAPDTTLWTCYPGTDTLIEIDASDPDAIDTNFYEMDSLLGATLGIADDSLLLVIYYVGVHNYILTLNINASPPTIVSVYKSPHLSYAYYGTASLIIDSLYLTMDKESPGDLAIFDLSDPTNIDTFATAIDHALGYWYEIIDSFLYSTTFQDPDLEYPYTVNYRIAITNITDLYSPVYDTFLTMITRDSYDVNLSCPSVVHDTLMFVAANYEEMVLADVYNISDPTAPVYVGQLGPNTYLDKNCMIYENDYLYAGAWIKDMQGYPDTDSLVGYAVGAPRWMEVCGSYLYRITGASFVAFEFYEFDTTRQAINENPPSAKPATLAISAYPNPFNSSVTIAIDGVGAGFTPACVEIYDVNGRRVATVTEPVEVPVGVEATVGRLAKDTSTSSVSVKSPLLRGDLGGLVWSPAPSLPSGIYLVRASMGGRGDLDHTGKTATKRVVYLK